MIINTSSVHKILIATRPVDMRKSIDGLMLVVCNDLQLDVLDNTLFIFFNQSRNRMKILYYDRNGFCLFLKRLDRGRFKLFDENNEPIRTITEHQLSWILQGLSPETIQPKTAKTSQILM